MYRIVVNGTPVSASFEEVSDAIDCAYMFIDAGAVVNLERFWDDEWQKWYSLRALQVERIRLSMSEHQRRVGEFMILAKQDVPEEISIPPAEVRLLRAKLLLEETLETIEALGVSVVSIVGEWAEVNKDDFKLFADGIPDLAKIIDGCCDVSVVATGTLSACGVPDTPFIELVDANNLAKFGPGHSWDADGKLIKPPGHQGPDIAGLVKKLGGEA